MKIKTAEKPKKWFTSQSSRRIAEESSGCTSEVILALHLRRFLACLVLCTSPLFLFACGEKVERNPETFVESSLGDARRLNPVIANDSASATINDQVFNGLVKYDKDIKLIGDLAERWVVTNKGKTITFYLRKSVKWHDGVEFTAEDCLFTYQKFVDPNVATPYSSSYMDVKRAEVVNKYVFRVTYKEPFSPALESWTAGMIPKHLLEGKDINTDSFNRHPIGTGPYKFKEWVTGQKIVLDANEDYFEGRPNIDQFIYRIVPDSSTMFQELLSGGIDMMGLNPLQYLRKSETRRIRENYNKFRYPSNSFTYLGYNLLNPLFEDVKVRRALSYAIDRQGIIDGILLGLGRPCTGPFSYVSWAYNPNAKIYAYDPGRARSMLAQAGWHDGGGGILEKNGKPFRFTIMTNQGNTERIRTAEIIQQNLKAVGIAVNIRVMEWQAFLEQIDKRSFDAIILGWSMGRDPDLYDIWHSSKTKKGEYNFIGYKNPVVDRLLVEGRRTFDMNKRKKIYYRIHAILAEEQPYAFLYVPDALPIVHKRFKGIKVEPLGIFYNFREWYVPRNRSDW
ncbi:MAG TPA: peptide-binding protein [Nitrospirota bacterium]|nr:peptide-binding protein [Nitrospirota bacterium]